MSQLYVSEIFIPVSYLLAAHGAEITANSTTNPVRQLEGSKKYWLMEQAARDCRAGHWHEGLAFLPQAGMGSGGETGSTQYLCLPRRDSSLLWDRALPGSVCPTLPRWGTENCENKPRSLDVRAAGTWSNSLRRTEGEELWLSINSEELLTATDVSLTWMLPTLVLTSENAMDFEIGGVAQLIEHLPSTHMIWSPEFDL